MCVHAPRPLRPYTLSAQADADDCANMSHALMAPSASWMCLCTQPDATSSLGLPLRLCTARLYSLKHPHTNILPMSRLGPGAAPCQIQPARAATASCWQPLHLMRLLLAGCAHASHQSLTPCNSPQPWSPPTSPFSTIPWANYNCSCFPHWGASGVTLSIKLVRS